MDMVSRRSTSYRDGHRAVRRPGRPAQTAERETEQRRLVQLLVSLVLFLMVYIGRGVFPAQIEVCRNIIYSNVDFSAAFQEFSRVVSEGNSIGDSLEALCVRVFGGESEQSVPAGNSTAQAAVPPRVVLLGQTPGAGLSYLDSHGVMVGRERKAEADEPVPSTVPEPEPETVETSPAVVTALAQEYSADGVKLPRNVSFAFYELGLPETVVPVNGPVTSTFGYRDSPVDGKYEFHLALDIGAEEGTEIGAFASGVVRYIGESDEFGQYLMIDHANNVSSFYAHCSKLLVHKGDAVSCGQTVALVGQTGNATGPHLHLTIEKDNVRLDPAYYVEPA